MIIENLNTIPIFIDLDADELKDVSESCTPRKYPKNSMIILEEEFGDIVFIIIQGTVKITRVNDEGKEVILSLLGPGEIFGEMAILDGEPRSADATAIEDCILFKINQRDFSQVLSIQNGVMISIIKILTKRLRETTQKVYSN